LAADAEALGRLRAISPGFSERAPDQLPFDALNHLRQRSGKLIA
jgi:hypothetical protein